MSVQLEWAITIQRKAFSYFYSENDSFTSDLHKIRFFFSSILFFPPVTQHHHLMLTSSLDAYFQCRFV